MSSWMYKYMRSFSKGTGSVKRPVDRAKRLRMGGRERSNLCFGWIVGQWKLLLSMADILFQVPVFVYLYFCLFLYFFLKKLGRTKRDTLGGKKKNGQGKTVGKNSIYHSLLTGVAGFRSWMWVGTCRLNFFPFRRCALKI